jgi:hypothetical protein
MELYFKKQSLGGKLSKSDPFQPGKKKKNKHPTTTKP